MDAPRGRVIGKARGRTVALVAAVALVLGAGLAAYLMAERLGEGRADPSDAEQVARGAAVYAGACASCHGARLEGEADWRTRKADGRLPAPPHDQTGHTWHHADDQLFGITKHGLKPYAPAGYESDMPAFAGALSDAEMWAAIAFIKSAWPPQERRYQERLNEKARAAGKGR